MSPASKPGLVPIAPGRFQVRQIRGVDPAGRDQALSLLLTGKATSLDPVAEQFVAFADSQKLSLDLLWVASESDEPRTAMLVIPNRGRTGMAFVSPMPTGRPIDEALTAVARYACESLDPDQVNLVQILLEPHQHRHQEALEASGFQTLAELVYMRRLASRGVGQSPGLELDAGLEVVHWAPQHHDLFANAILATYQDTKDCTRLVGLRNIDDIMAGHMDTGQFIPELWFVIRQGDEPVAVMLLGIIPQQQAMELVYLGVCPSSRGQGLGRSLVQHALDIARGHGATHILLAVDGANEPAVRLYESLQFVAHVRKTAMIYAVPHAQ